MTTSRRTMKADKPRPLKITSDQSMESILAEMDAVSQYLTSSPSDRSLYTTVISLCENLKMFGPQLENIYKDQLDRCFVAIRNGCRDDNISLASRYRLLEVIELRAMQWQPNENLVHYYKQKLAQIEAEENAMEEPDTTYANPMTPVNASPGMFPNYQQPVYPNQSQSYATPSQTKPLISVPVPPTLSPGEIIKSSGKYTKPTRIPGKNVCKDEVVIRNPDSGKVMGLKGRRVHMIEELSETVISFQRVSPGARERLVQITGPNEDNIYQAKQLIEETIRRNSSPVRPDDRNMFNNMGGSSSSISSHNSEDLQGKRSANSYNIEEPLTEYKYTVIHNEDVLRITGSNLDVVRTAKLVLDEFFNSEHNLNSSGPILSPHIDHAATFFPVESPINGDTADKTENATKESNKSPPSVEDTKSSLTVVRQPLIPSSSREAIGNAEVNANHDVKNRRALFAKTSDDKSNDDACVTEPVLPCGGKNYSREFMIQCSTKPASRSIPPNWASVIRRVPMVVKKGSQLLPFLQTKINEIGEDKFNGGPTYLEEGDLINEKTLPKGPQYEWTLIRSLSGIEDEETSSAT